MEEDKDQIIIGSSPSIDASKFVIKLKIPKLENETIESLKMSNEAKRVCPECKKEFSSGKALGGHMRIHAQSFNTNPNFPKTKKYYKKHNHQQEVDMIKKVATEKPYYTSSVNNEGKPTCTQCSKTFPSMKSLFGHMRCHPERNWRGILPPPNTVIRGDRSFVSKKSKSYLSGSQPSPVSINEEDKNNGDNEVIDLTKFLRRWGATKRRGRPSLKLDNDEDEDGVLLEAVDDLMSLAQGHPCMTFEGSNSNSLSNKDKGKSQVKMESDDYCHESDSWNNAKQQQVVYRSPSKMKKRKKMKLMMDLQPDFDLSPNAELQEEVVAGDECKYKCTACNKCFASHQALGGHRSSHNKVRITSLAVDHNHEQQGEFESFEFAGDHHTMVVMRMSSLSNNISVHQCKICDKVFATGQALGGHKRCHWTGIIGPQQVQVQVIAQAQDPSSQITSTGEESGSGRKVLEFDLNEIPSSMMEEDEAGNGNGIGYASSSFNSNMG